VTLDYYNIKIDDRLGLQNVTVSDSDLVDLIGAGIPNADLLLGSNLNYFSNAFDTEITGLDLAITTSFDMGEGDLFLDFRHNINDQEVSGVRSGTINAGRVYDLENQVPTRATVASLNYAQGNFDGLLRVNSYGDWDTTGGVFGPGDASDAITYNGNVLVDLEVNYTFSENYTVTLGGENIFDVIPDVEDNGTLQALGVQNAITSPWGFNGGFWYVRLSADF
jgi:iron complex outermembrane receptor protein